MSKLRGIGLALKVLISASVFSFFLYFSLSRFRDGDVGSVRVLLNQGGESYFLDQDTLVSLAREHNPLGKLGGWDIHTLKARIKSFPASDSVEVYLDANGRLNVDIQERIPLMRMAGSGGGFYLDRKGAVFPLSEKYSCPCVLVSENIPGEDYLALSKLVSQIRGDEFSRDFFVGITKIGNDYNLFTREGYYRVEIGDLESFDVKLRGFKSFLKKYMVHQDPLKYEKISLKYKGQIVAKLRKRGRTS